MITIPFLVLNNSADPTCKPLNDIKMLLRAAALPHFQAVWGQAPRGDCHAVAGDFDDGPRQCGSSTSITVV
jgi:hypothetical protein